MKTTCLKCKSVCNSFELDEFYECGKCQGKFYRKMIKKATSHRGKGKTKHQKSYVSDIPPEIRGEILSDATELYKGKYKSKKELIKYINRTYNTNMTSTVFDMLATDANLKKYGLNWKYK